MNLSKFRDREKIMEAARSWEKSTESLSVDIISTLPDNECSGDGWLR